MHVMRLMRRSKRVPVILQMSQVECAAACLAMVLAYHGRHTRIADCREACGAGRDGLTAQTIIDVARAQGLEATATAWSPPIWPACPCPRSSTGTSTISWSSSTGQPLEAREIVDPATGRRRIPPAEFDASFTGVTLLLQPGPNFEPRRSASTKPWRTHLMRLAATPGIRSMLFNAGGKWVDKEVVRDGNFVSSRQPTDIPAFDREMIALFAEPKARARTAS